MKDHAFLTSPVSPQFISPNDSISTQRDDYLIPILSNNNFTFKSKITSLYMHPIAYTFKLYDKNQDFFTSLTSKIMTSYQYWLDNNGKSFSLQYNFLRPPIYDLKTDEMILHFFLLLRKQHITLHTLPFSNIKSQKKYIFVNYKYTSLHTITHLYTIDYSRITIPTKLTL